MMDQIRDRQASNEEPSPLEEFAESLASGIRRHPKTAAAIGLGILAGLGGVIITSQMRELAFKNRLLENPPEGRIAMAVGKSIVVLEADALLDPDRRDRTFNLGRQAGDLAWLDSERIAFTAPARERGHHSRSLPTGEPAIPDPTVISDSIFILNLADGSVNNVFDPYKSPLFPDAEQQDELKESQWDALFDQAEKKPRRSVIVYGNPATVNITALGTEPATDSIFFQAQGTWYSLSLSNAEARLVGEIPAQLVSDFTRSADGTLQITRPTIFHEYRITDGTVEGVIVKEGGSCPTWGPEAAK